MSLRRRLFAAALLVAVVAAPMLALAQVRFTGRGGDQTVVGSASAPTRIRSSFTAPPNPMNGDTWIECTTTQPVTCAHNIRFNGQTYAIGTVTIQ